MNDTRIGWTAGAGVEYAFAPAWSAKLEYNYMDFGNDAVSFAPGTLTNIDQQIHAVKFGVNYKFGRRAWSSHPLSQAPFVRKPRVAAPGLFFVC